MSDSDDTDVLLLIPPDFFIVNNQKNSISNDSLITNNNNSFSNCIDDNSTIVSDLINNKHNNPLLVSTKSVDEELESLNNRLFEINNYNNNNIDKIMNRQVSDDDTMVNYKEFSTMPTATAADDYQSTPKYKYYNLKSSQIDEQQQPPLKQPPQPPPSKISTASQPLSFHSNYQMKRDNQHQPIITQKDDRFLREIDYFLIGNNNNNNNNNNNKSFNSNVDENNVKSLPALSTNHLAEQMEQPPTTSIPVTQNDEKLHTFANEILNRHSKMLNKQKSKIAQTNHVVASTNLNDSAQLMSLSYIWGPEGQQETETIEVERIRRQHCEKTIQVLQSKLLEYQQKISVAIKIDKTKDTAIGKYHEANSILTTKLSKTEHRLMELEEQIRNEKKYLQIENEELKDKNQMMDSELLQTIGMLKQFQQRNELLESKLDNLTISTNDIQDIHRKQLEDLEVRLSNSKHIESELNTEMTILKNTNKKLQCELDKISKSYNDIKKITDDNTNELEIVKEQKRNLSEKLHDERERFMNLESRKNNLQHTIDVLNEKEKTFAKELETQRIALKSYYQNQLEQVVSQKVMEFQKEIDKLDEVLKSDGKRRERLIAERAIKQMQLMNEKNEQEYQLITQKHNEEIALYRLQLDNSTQTINELQSKLNAYQSKRADIAERLHNVMEIQWQKALEIITSPNNVTSDGCCSSSSSRIINEQKQLYTHTVDDINQSKSIDIKKLDKDRVDGVAGLLHMQQTQTRAENETFETPTSSRQRQRHDTNEKLQAYIELLLKTSPRDLNQIIPSNYLDLANRDDPVDKSVVELKQHQMEKKNTSYQIKSLPPPPWK